MKFEGAKLFLDKTSFTACWASLLSPLRSRLSTHVNSEKQQISLENRNYRETKVEKIFNRISTNFQSEIILTPLSNVLSGQTFPDGTAKSDMVLNVVSISVLNGYFFDCYIWPSVFSLVMFTNCDFDSSLVFCWKVKKLIWPVNKLPFFENPSAHLLRAQYQFDKDRDLDHRTDSRLYTRAGSEVTNFFPWKLPACRLTGNFVSFVDRAEPEISNSNRSNCHGQNLFSLSVLSQTPHAFEASTSCLVFLRSWRTKTQIELFGQTSDRTR